MLVYILDEYFNKKLVIDYYKSIIWNTRYTDSGDFEIYLPMLDETILDYIKINGFVYLNTDDTDLRIIEKINISYSIEEGYMVIISGHDAKSILKKRCVNKLFKFNGALTSAIYNMIRSNIWNTSSTRESRRTLNILKARLDDGYYPSMGNNINVQVLGENLFEKTKELLESQDFGMKFDFDHSDNKFFITFFKGLNRTSSQNVNDRIIFSSNAGNLLEYTIELDSTEYKNVAFVLGEGEGSNKTIAWCGNTQYTRLERDEVVFDAENLSDDGGVITQENYLSQLALSGESQLTNYKKKYNFDCKIYSDLFKFKKDFFVGDKVEINTKFKINNSNTVVGTITEVTETWNENGYECLPNIEFNY